MTELQLLKAIQLEAPKFGCRLFRNNVGVLKDARGRAVRFGLCTGSSDLIGWTPRGRFLAVEVKQLGKKPTIQQVQFIGSVRQHGGVGFWVDSLEEFQNHIQHELRMEALR